MCTIAPLNDCTVAVLIHVFHALGWCPERKQVQEKSCLVVAVVGLGQWGWGFRATLGNLLTLCLQGGMGGGGGVAVVAVCWWYMCGSHSTPES